MNVHVHVYNKRTCDAVIIGALAYIESFTANV